jgi:hypothetical protein
MRSIATSGGYSHPAKPPDLVANKDNIAFAHTITDQNGKFLLERENRSPVGSIATPNIWIATFVLQSCWPSWIVVMRQLL